MRNHAPPANIAVPILVIAGCILLYFRTSGFAQTEDGNHENAIFQAVKRNMDQEKDGFTRSELSIDYEEKPLGIVVVTQMRSGSSFTGELFNRNEDFLYYFEPLIGFGTAFFKNRTYSNAKKLIELPIQHLLQCNHKYISNWWNSDYFVAQQQCELSKSLQNTSLCKYDNKFKKYVPSAWTPPDISYHILDAACYNKKHRALKTIRLENINYLENVVKENKMNVKIIHLVRDPRGTHFSRLRVCEPGWLLCGIQYSCARLESNLGYWLNTPDWLVNRYMLVRYEDFAEKPLHVAKKIYAFIGIDMPQTVKDWLLENTRTTVVTKKSGEPYSHTRNSSHTATKWRTSLNFNTVLDIQSKCHFAMAKLGYKFVDTVKSLRNLNISLIESLPLVA